jgi:lipid A disaccharide synthetase
MPAATNPKQIFISAGEASGDMYAARLAAELAQRTGVHLFGMGGERMAPFPESVKCGASCPSCAQPCVV